VLTAGCDELQLSSQLVAVGQQIWLECSLNVTDVDWWFRKESIDNIQNKPDKRLLVLSGKLTSTYNERGRISSKNAVVLKNISKDDSGIYWCSSDSGHRSSSIYVKVMGKTVSCCLVLVDLGSW
jgi:hypothetical protein